MVHAPIGLPAVIRQGVSGQQGCRVVGEDIPWQLCIESVVVGVGVGGGGAGAATAANAVAAVVVVLGSLSLRHLFCVVNSLLSDAA